jgi:hypothetical protein
MILHDRLFCEGSPVRQEYHEHIFLHHLLVGSWLKLPWLLDQRQQHCKSTHEHVQEDL